MMAMRDAAAAGLARLTPRRVQEVLDESISIAVDSRGEQALSEIFLERLCLAVGAAWIRVCESADTGLRGVLTAGDSAAAAACEHAEFLRETAAGVSGELRERVAANGVRCIAAATDLAPGLRWWSSWDSQLDPGWLSGQRVQWKFLPICDGGSLCRGCRDSVNG